MSTRYDYPHYAYRRSPDQDVAGAVRRPVVIVGAGPVGLCAAIDLAGHGVPAVVLDDNDTVSVGSRAICFSKRTLEILDRLGVGQRAVDKGVTWQRGKVFHGKRKVYEFDLLPEDGHRRPAFINLQQYYLEEYLIDRAGELDGVDLRWRNRVTSVDAADDGVTLQVETPDGPYALESDWVIACDGAQSDVRAMLGLEFAGQTFRDHFLIADIVMRADFPKERWFWFDPPFHKGQSALLHRQPGNMWRIDLQLGRDADPEREKDPDRVTRRIRRMLGADTRFEVDWVSIYTFDCRRLGRFRHGRVLFAGDAAHQVSPFGARGANGGIQDIDNLVWKLARVLDGRSPEALIDSFDVERVFAADENIRNSTRSTDFITPKSPGAQVLRNAALSLAASYPFAQRMVNSGRLSVPAILRDSPLNTPDEVSLAGVAPPGAVVPDAPVRRDGGPAFLFEILGQGFTLLIFADQLSDVDALAAEVCALTDEIAVIAVFPASGAAVADASDPNVGLLVDAAGLMAHRFDGTTGSAFLIRPDHHVVARWRRPDVEKIMAAFRRATCIA